MIKTIVRGIFGMPVATAAHVAQDVDHQAALNGSGDFNVSIVALSKQRAA